MRWGVSCTARTKMSRAFVHRVRCPTTFTRPLILHSSITTAARLYTTSPADAYVLSSKADSRPTRGGYILRDLLIEIGPAGDGGDTGSMSSSQASSSSATTASSGGGKWRNGIAADQRRETFCQLLSQARDR